jgi:uncharacterized repeat protein (TIGR01451 family)
MSSTFLKVMEIDPNGFIWVAGTNPVELAVKDSTGWTVYSPLNSGLPDEDIEALAFGPSGEVWIGTEGAGVVRFDGQNWDVFTSATHALAFDDVNEFQWVGNELWMTTFPGGVSVFDGTTWIDRRVGPNHGNTGAITVDLNQHIWVGHVNGFAEYDGTAWTLYSGDSLGLSPDFVVEIAADSNGRIWFDSRTSSQSGRLGYLENYELTEFPPSPDFPWLLQQVPSGDIVYNDQAATFRFSNGELKVDSFANVPYGFRYFVEDFSGNWWYRSSIYDVNRFDGTTTTTWNFNNSNLPTQRQVRNFFVDRIGRVWLTADAGGVAYFDGNDWVVFNKQNSGLLDNDITAIGQGTDSTMVFVDENGNLSFFKGQSWKTVTKGIYTGMSGQRNYLALEDTSDFWYAGKDNGLHHYQNGAITTYATTNSGLPTEKINGMVKQDNGDIWLGVTDLFGGGIVVFDGNNWEYLDFFNSPLPLHNVWAMLLDDAGNTWVAGTGYLARVGENTSSPTYPMRGKVFHDANGNGQVDAGEQGIAHQQLTLQPSGQKYFSNSLGEFEIFAPAGNYDLSLNLLPQFQLTAGTNNYNLSLDSVNNVSDGNDFALQPSGTHPDLVVSMATGRLRCGRALQIWLEVENQSDALATGAELAFYLDPFLSLLSSSISPDQQSGDTLLWQLGDLLPLEKRQIQFFTDPLGLTIGDTIANAVSVMTSAQELNLLNNQDSVFLPFFCSYDPNDKLAQPEGTGAEHEILLNRPITYTIRFQNTGNDTAYLVALIDTIDAHFALETLSFVQASHDFAAFFLDDRTLKIVFDDIMLPDSLTDPDGSQGFIKYRISPLLSMLSGTKVFNKASIFFDGNAPIITNTVEHTYVEFLTALDPEELKPRFEVFPNPAQDRIRVELEEKFGFPQVLMMTDVYGRTIRQFDLNRSKVELDLDQVVPGIYLLHLQDQVSRAIRLVVE